MMAMRVAVYGSASPVRYHHPRPKEAAEFVQSTRPDLLPLSVIEEKLPLVNNSLRLSDEARAQISMTHDAS